MLSKNSYWKLAEDNCQKTIFRGWLKAAFGKQLLEVGRRRSLENSRQKCGGKLLDECC